MNTFEESLGKGVPVNTPIVIPSSDLYNISSNKERLSKRLATEFKKYIEFMSRGTKRVDLEIYQTLMVVTDKKTAQKKLCFAPLGLINSLLTNLNIRDLALPTSIRYNVNGEADYSHLLSIVTPACDSKIELLRNIKSEKQLRREFPALYLKYQPLKKTSDALAYRLSPKNYPNPLQLLQARKLFTDKMKAQIPDFDLSEYENVTINSFCEKYANAISSIISGLSETIDYMVNNPLSESLIEEQDREKLELLIAHTSLTYAEKTEKEKQRYLYYVSNYFGEDKKRKNSQVPCIKIGSVVNKSIGVTQNGTKITPESIYKRYQQLLVENPNLQVIDFSNTDFSTMTLQEVEEFMVEFLRDLSANWDLLPGSKNNLPTPEQFTEEKDDNKPKIDRIAHQKKLLELFMEKKSFYGEQDCFFRIIGKNTFDGYIGHIYSNGIIVLDKFYENSKTGRLADGQAIYVMSMTDFKALSSLPKQQLFTHPSCKRIIHNGAWQERVLKEITSKNNNINPADEVRKLIKNKDVEGAIS